MLAPERSPVGSAACAGVVSADPDGPTPFLCFRWAGGRSHQGHAARAAPAAERAPASRARRHRHRGHLRRRAAARAHHLALAAAAWPAAALLALIRSNARHTVSNLAWCCAHAHGHAHIHAHSHAIYSSQVRVYCSTCMLVTRSRTYMRHMYMSTLVSQLSSVCNTKILYCTLRYYSAVSLKTLIKISLHSSKAFIGIFPRANSARPRV